LRTEGRRASSLICFPAKHAICAGQ
jgi:hypothetical protein